MKKVKLLMVDDDQFIKKIYTDRFEAAGFDVTTAHSVNEGKNSFVDHEYDVVILDYVMPQESGIDFLKWLKDEKKLNIPVIVLSALNQEESKEEAKAAGASSYLVKDQVNPEALVEEVNRLLS